MFNESYAHVVERFVEDDVAKCGVEHGLQKGFPRGEKRNKRKAAQNMYYKHILLSPRYLTDLL